MTFLPAAVPQAMGTISDRAERVLEDVVFRLCVGVGVFVGATIIARYLLTPERSAPKPAESATQPQWIDLN